MTYIYKPFLSFIQRQGSHRVYWLLAVIVVISIIATIDKQLGEQNMHTMAGLYADNGLSPVDLLIGWRTQADPHYKLAIWELAIDTLLFIPAYVTALAVWCWYFSQKSLFVAPSSRHRQVARFMRRTGQWLIVGVLIGAAADLIENTIMLGWLDVAYEVPVFGWILRSGAALTPSLGMWIIRLVKMAPIALALLYILLHPLGLGLSLRETLFRLLGIGGFEQDQIRGDLLDYIRQHQTEKRGIEAILKPLGKNPRQLTFRTRRMALWRGFLNVQFVIYILLFLYGLLQLDQFDELFYSLMTSTGVAPYRILFFTLLALGLLSGMVYVTSKILLFIQPTYFGEFDPKKPAETAGQLFELQPELRLLQSVPLWLAHAPFLIIALTLIGDYLRLSAVTDEEATHSALSYLLFLLAAILVATYIFHRVVRKIHQSLNEQNIALFKPLNPSRDYALLVDLAPRSILFGQGILVASLMLFLPTVTGLPTAPFISLYAVVFLWLAAVAYLGTLVYQFNNLPDFPLIVWLIGMVLVFSRINDNSNIRQSPVNLVAKTDKPTLRRPTINEYYIRWLQTRQAFDTITAPDTLPVVVVATAGGGIRAAAGTTNVMAELNNQIPCFDHHLFAISGVSGGGVGAATYLAALTGDTVHLNQAGKPTPYHSKSLIARLRNVVTEDLISPISASMLFRGGINNFIPFPLNDLDRNRWLEDAWEAQMLKKENMPSDSMRRLLAESFLRLWPTSATLNNHSLYLPALLLNGAVAETGQKIVMSNLNLGNTSDRNNPFYDVADLFASTGHDIPYKTAAFLCARFPFVTSGGKAIGTLPNITANWNKNNYHIIDGGYAENTGIVTAVQLIKRLQFISDSLTQLAPQPAKLRRQIAYYLLFLPNYAASEDKGSVRTLRFLAEPVKGFLNTWDRNGVSLDQLIGRTLQGSKQALSFGYASLTLDTRKHHYPLGWYLSPSAFDTMGQQATRDIQSSLNDSTQVNAPFFSHLLRQIR